MSKRLALLARLLGIAGLLGGVVLVLASWALATPAYEVARAVVPRLIFSEPLIWLGLALLLSPTFARLMAQEDARGALHAHGVSASGYDSVAYVQCPECEQLVRLDLERCPYCGERISGMSGRAS